VTGGGPYAAELKKAASRSIKALDRQIAAAVLDAVDGLKTDPRPAGMRPLKGRPGVLRIVVRQHWRVLYQVSDAERRIEVIDVGHRSSIYG
jgi:addiction module RelE/StbE family toxin